MALSDGENDGRRVIERKDLWMEGLKKKHDSKQVDKEALVPKKFDMAELANGYVDLPKKVSIIGQPGDTSARSAKGSENTVKGSKEASANLVKPSGFKSSSAGALSNDL